MAFGVLACAMGLGAGIPQLYWFSQAVANNRGLGISCAMWALTWCGCLTAAGVGILLHKRWGHVIAACASGVVVAGVFAVFLMEAISGGQADWDLWTPFYLAGSVAVAGYSFWYLYSR